MSGRRPSPAQDLARMLGPLDGARIAGGCEVCDAYQTVEVVSLGVWLNVVHHDDDCHVLAAYEGRR